MLIKDFITKSDLEVSIAMIVFSTLDKYYKKVKISDIAKTTS
jgi:hypothetical protein